MWTNIPKPSSTPYTNVNTTVGKQQYDDPNFTYDSSAVFYDAVNVNQWSLVARPVIGNTIRPGMTTGLMISLTYNQTTTFVGKWTNVAKPT